MPPKKKKTQLKPVVRGFATISQPKKTVQDVALNSSQISSDVQPEGSKNQAPELAQPAPSTPSFDPDSVKNQSLQNLVDKLQEKTEKEITRSIKVVETEKRFAQTFPRLDFDSILTDRILKITLSEGIKVPKAIDEAEDKMIARLGITYGVLRRLGFTEVIVENCLRNISSIELEDAFDWLYLHCSEPELQTNNLERAYPNALKLREYAGVSLRQHSTPPVTPRLESESSSRKRSPEPRSTILPAIDPNLMSSKQVDSCDINFDLLALDGCLLDPESPSPTTAFVRTKLLYDFARAKSLSSDSEEQLRGQMVALSSDYLFDKREAQELYAREKERLNYKLLQERLLSPPSGTKTTNAAKSTPTPSPYCTDSQQDSDSDESSTGMFGILDNPDASEVTVKGITLNLRRMDLPKHWSGPTPKTMLRDFVIKQDRYVAISYSTLSKHSRARRASVIISWQSKIRDEWMMDDVACPDDNQAENFVATIALHSLMYPISEGFASPTPVSSITSFRLLPAVYRGLWDELETSRRINEDITNRKVWAKLQSILEGKTQVKKASERQTKQLIEKGLSALLQPTIDNTIDFGALVTAFQVRQASQAYGSILTQRNRLPIARYRDDIIKLLDVSQVLVLSGETGCGKSTQVPSFILEHHLSVGKPCKVICTEPRRISAISLAHRVSYELCDPPQGPSSLVGYSIRLESNISRNTRLAFVTNGIALRMLETGSGQGTGLDDVTHIIVDEVHERSIESDFLLIVLKELLAGRSDLKVILMSATLDAEKISGYFDNCPTLHVPGRTFPVTVQHLEDAIEYTRWSITETSPYAHRWSDKFSKGKNRPDWTEDRATLDDDDDDAPSTSQGDLKLEKRYSPETIATLNIIDERLIPYDLIVRLLEKICFEDQHYKPFSAAVLVFMPGLGEIRRLNDMLIEHPLLGSSDFNLYPLHSTLSNESQGAAFDIPPPGVRKIVIATNIAETGITIPDITCVIDSGKHREMRFDEKRQISRLIETFIAKSNATQRRGRAGRVQHGLCFHLFTKLRYETQMVENPIPEMLRLSLSDLALKIKILNVKLGTSIGEVLSRALDPPTAINVQRAVSMLVEARALTTTEDITPMGRLLSKLPTDVHLGKCLLIATVFRCLDPVLTIAATLNSKSPFVVPMGLENDADRAKASFCTDNSDFLTIHNAFSSWRRACANPAFVGKFCRANFLSHKNLQQIEELRQQFLGFLIDSSFIQADKSLLKELSRARYARNKTRFVSVPAELDINSNNPILIHAAITAGLYPKILSINSKNRELRTITNNQFVSFHPTSVNFGKNPAEFGVNHLVYFTIMHSKKLYAWETGPVDDLALVLLCGDSEHKLLADTVSIDRKLRFQVPPRVNLALKILREQLGNLLAQQYQGKILGELHNVWKEIGLLAMGHVKVDPDENETLSVA